MTGCKTKEINYQFYNRAADLPATWNTLLPSSHFLRTENITVTEQTNLPDVSFVYALICKNNKAIAAVYFQVLELKKQHLDTTTLNPILRMSWSAYANIAKPKLLVAGHLFRHDVESYYYAPSLSSFDAYKMYITAINAVKKQTCASAVLIKDVNVSLTEYFANYNPKYIRLRNDISMELEIKQEWESMADYEKALKHKYAQRYRKIRSSWKDIEIKELNADEVTANKATIYDLYKKVCERQPARIGYLSADYIPALKKAYPEQLKVWGIYKNGTPIAFFSAWLNDEVFDMFYIGFDYKLNNEVNLYFNILYSTIEHAILFKKNKLVLGRTALDAKARLGCKPHYQSTFVYISNRVLRQAVSFIQQRNQSQEGEWEQKHPMKSNF
ncbi:MAG: GNAT family N-acetyltransferase [Bacteroidetes bacterium]|nr:GNAT family N-acetyltransferase [Bacteroidota bacterium]